MSTANSSVLIVADRDAAGESIRASLASAGYPGAIVVIDACKAADELDRYPASVLVASVSSPSTDAFRALDHSKSARHERATVLLTADERVRAEFQRMPFGPDDHVLWPQDLSEVPIVLRRISVHRKRARANDALRRQLRRERRLRDVIGNCPAMRRVFDLARSASWNRAPVLLTGEAGTGKELIARAIHGEGPRQHSPFISVHCRAMTEALIASELFGSEPEAFTGATGTHRGAFERAHGGTLYLHDLARLTSRMQALLLRAIDESRVTRLGARESVPVDVRLIAASDLEPSSRVAEGAIRADLYERLAFVRITIPPLRDRRDDIPLLVDAFLEEVSAELKKEVTGVSGEAMHALMRLPLPGNVEELRHLVQRAVVCSPGPVLQSRDFDLEMPGHAATPATLEEVERQHIAAVLEGTRGNVSRAARILDIDRVTLYNKIRKYRLREPAGA